MSRGFVKDGDQEEVPILTPRAFLPKGAPNYVTPNGLEELKKEKEELEKRIQTLKDESADRNRVKINYINAKVLQVDERINSARPIKPEDTDKGDGTVRFGAIVTLLKEDNYAKDSAKSTAKDSAKSGAKDSSKSGAKNCEYQIVGVDEANPDEHKVSFISPFARALLNKKIGELVKFEAPSGDRIMKILKIKY